MSAQPSLIQSYLLAEGLLDRSRSEFVERHMHATGVTFPCAAVNTGLVDEDRLLALLQSRLKLRQISPRELFDIPSATVAMLDAAFAVRHRVLVLSADDNELTLVMSDPSNQELCERVERRTGLTVTRAVTFESALGEALEHHYGVEITYDPQPASGELASLFSRREDSSPILLTRAKPELDLEGCVTAPLPRIELPLPAPPPLPLDLDKEEQPPPIPAEALEEASVEEELPKVRTQPLPAALTTQPLPKLQGADTLADEYALSSELSLATLPGLSPGTSPGDTERLRAALSSFASVAGRCLVLGLRDDGSRLVGWFGEGLGPAVDVASIDVPMEQGSVFARALAGPAPFMIAPLGFGRSERLFATMVGKHAREMLLAPIAGVEGPLGLLYADELSRPVGASNVEPLLADLARVLTLSATGMS